MIFQRASYHWLVLWGFCGFVLSALIGYATFGVHPEWLTNLPTSLGEFYGQAFILFSRGQIWFSGLTLFIGLVVFAGARWIPGFIAVYTLSLVSELSGTTSGLPFGPYSYTELLGTKWFDHVPVVIPLSWFTMALPGYVMAHHLVPQKPWARVLLASYLLVAWDLSLDPAMSFLTKYWVWGAEGPYYGMPLLNLFGWFVTGLALMMALELLKTHQWAARFPIRWITAYYLAVLLLPIGMCAAAGLWWAVALSLASLAVVLVPCWKKLW